MNMRRVVITGIGVVSPLGIGAVPFFNALLDGRHGFAPIRSFDTAGFRQVNGAEVAEDALQAAREQDGFPSLDKSVEMGLVAAAEAFRQAGLDPGVEHPWAAILGSCLCCMHGVGASMAGYRDKGVRGVRPTAMPRYMGNALSSNLSIRFKLTGPNYTLVSACASSSAAIGLAYRMIRSGLTDGAMTGGSDASFVPTAVAGWNNLGLLSTEPDPGLCCRPFDRDRDGTALGEGAAVLILEEREQAKARKAVILGELAGYAENSDAVHLANPRAESQAEAVRLALREAGLIPSDLNLINAHGTGTILSDKTEAEALRMALGRAADGIPVVSLKSYFGHTHGACGALETLAGVRALADGRMPGNRNLANPDPDCPIALAGTAPISLGNGVCLKTCFGFGGHNTALILKPAD